MHLLLVSAKIAPKGWNFKIGIPNGRDVKRTRLYYLKSYTLEGLLSLRSSDVKRELITLRPEVFRFMTWITMNFENSFPQKMSLSVVFVYVRSRSNLPKLIPIWSFCKFVRHLSGTILYGSQVYLEKLFRSLYIYDLSDKNNELDYVRYNVSTDFLLPLC